MTSPLRPSIGPAKTDGWEAAAHASDAASGLRDERRRISDLLLRLSLAS